LPDKVLSVAQMFFILLLQKNYIKEDTIERMRLDEEVLMDFFREHINVTVSLVSEGSLFCLQLQIALHSKLKLAIIPSESEFLHLTACTICKIELDFVVFAIKHLES
jgi:hypothetical protein